MAMEPAKTAKSGETVTGLDLILQSRSLLADLMYKFRECHDLCEDSKLFSVDVMLEIDTCAVTFRKLCLDTVTVARVVSDQWLDSTIMFFKHIADIDKDGLKDTMILLGKQAKEIGMLFKVIAAWARNLAARFHKTQTDTIKEAEDFKSKFENAKLEAQTVQDEVKKQSDQRKKTHERADSVESTWKTAQVLLSWNPIGAIVTAYGASAATKSAKIAKELNDEATQKLNIAKKAFKKCEKNSDKAKHIAEKALELVTFLHKVEAACEAIASFWTMESDKFLIQGGKMQTNHANIVKSLTSVVAKNNIEYWTVAKTELKLYADATTQIGSSCNFITNAVPPQGQEYNCDALSFKLNGVPPEAVKSVTA